jgi:hypothetical protein
MNNNGDAQARNILSNGILHRSLEYKQLIYIFLSLSLTLSLSLLLRTDGQHSNPPIR